MDGDDKMKHSGINSLPGKLKSYSLIKDAFDNLPGGICFFDDTGVPILVNRTMHRLVYALTERSIQDISDLDAIMRTPNNVIPGDGTVWRFMKRSLGGGSVTEITAADITELYRRKKELERDNAELREIMKRTDEISRNVVSITRNEEILALKMRIHNDLGYSLGDTRLFISEGCPEDKKAEYIARQEKMAKKLSGEIGNDDETHIFSELKENARKLGAEIICDGDMPAFAEELMTKAVRECLLNTVRHAGGRKVFVRAKNEGGKYTAVITNDGKPPECAVTEGGGLSSLRRSIEENAGTMTVECAGGFSLTITLNEKEQ